MLKKLGKAFLGLFLVFSSMLPASLLHAEANVTEEKFMIVDDSQTNPSNTHYFTYYGGNGDGANGWSDSDDNNITGSTELKTQHWTWNQDGSKVKSFYYTFTFEGTGVDLVGIVPAGATQNEIELDGKKVNSETLPGTGNKKEHVIYQVRNLQPIKHTVTVKLPDNPNMKGLQISYAKVYGSTVSEDDMVVTDTIKPTVSDGINSFSFTGAGEKEWTITDKEAFIDFKESSTIANESYYEVHFIGNKIEIEAAKSHNHGIVEFKLDEQVAKEVDLYNETRTNQIVFDSGYLSEGKHTLKVQTTNKKNAKSSSIVNQVVKAKVHHKPYKLESLDVDSTLDMIVEAQTKLNVKLNPDYANPKGLKFESNNKEVATVNEKGVVTAVKPGSATITVSADGVDSKQVKIQVKEQIKAMSGSIVDENLQWTQTKREEVSKMGTLSKNLSAWKADKAISEFVIYAKESSLKNVSLEISDFKNDQASISKDHVSATFIKSTKAFTGMPGWGYNPDRYPIENETNRKESSDILYTTEPVDINYDKVQPVWVEVNVPKNTPAGIYTGTVKVTTPDIKDEALTFTFHVKVQDVVLPDTSTYKDTFDIELWQYPYTSAEYYHVTPFSTEHMNILKSIMTKYKSIGGHAITTTISEDAWDAQTYSTKDVHYPSMIKWNLVKGEFNNKKEISKDFKFEYDFTDFDKWVQFNKDLGIGDKIVLYSIAPWHNSFTYWVNGKLQKTGFTPGSDTYNRVWKDFFEAMVKHLDEKGWFEDAYVGIDERGLKKEAFDLLDTIKNKDGKTLKTAGAMDGITTGDHPELARRITDLNVGDSVVQNPTTKAAFDQLVSDRKKLGLRTTLYSCTGHIPGNFSLSAPAESYWSMMYAYKSGTAGFLRWAYDAWVENPLEDTTHSSFEAGDCFLIYPDKKDAKNPVAKSSLRLEKMAQGVRDINKLMMMEKEYPQLQDSIKKVMNHLQTTYESNEYFLTENGKLEIAKDMNELRTGIDQVTEEYLQLKEKDNVVVARDELKVEMELSKAYLDQEKLYTVESFSEFKKAYVYAEEILNHSVSRAIVPSSKEIKEATVNLKAKREALVLKSAGNDGSGNIDSDHSNQTKPDSNKVTTGVVQSTQFLWVLGIGAGIVFLMNRRKMMK